MGRPVNKKNFGATGVDAAPTIPIRFHDGTSLIEGKIVSQRGNAKSLSQMMLEILLEFVFHE